MLSCYLRNQTPDKDNYKNKFPGRQSGQTFLTFWVAVVGAALFVIVYLSCCPGLIVPVACSEPEEVCIQSPEKEVVKPGVESSVTVKGPKPNVTAWLPPSVREKEDG